MNFNASSIRSSCPLLRGFHPRLHAECCRPSIVINFINTVRSSHRSPRRRSSQRRLQAASAHLETEVPAQPLQFVGFSTGFHSIYKLEEQIGRGAEGDVFVGIKIDTDERYAVKRSKKVFMQDGSGLSPAFCERMLHQIDVYRAVGRGLSIAHLYDVFEDDDYVYSVQELCTGGELWQHIGDHYSEAYAARIMRYVLQTIAQFHEHEVVWRDVKPENFLFLNEDDDSPLKAVDLGTAERCKIGEYITNRAGSPLFVAPEVLSPARYNHAADIWGAGMLAYMIMCARLPFSTPQASASVADLYSGAAHVTRRQAFEALLGYHLDFESPHFTDLSDGAQEFIKMLLKEEPEERPTAGEALAHHWIVEDAPDTPFSHSLVQRLQRFGSYSRFKQVVLQAMVSEVRGTDEVIIPAELHAEFETLDPEGTGVIPYEAMQSKLHSEPFCLSNQEVERLLKQMNITEGDGIRYDDWLATMLTWRTVQKTVEWDSWVEAAFASMDEDSTGQVSQGELSRFLCSSEHCLSEDDLRDALQEAQRTFGDSMTLQGFKEMLSATPMNHTDDEADLDIFHSRVSDSRDDP